MSARSANQPEVSSFRTRLRAGELVAGTMVTLPSPAVAEIFADAGFDWLFVDAEHGPFETHDIALLLQVVGDRVACIVRVTKLDEGLIKKSLDLGAAGVIIPQVNTVQQAELAVRYSRYSPLGARGVGLARAHGYGMKFKQYVENANDEVSVIVQAEHIEAVENIEAIVQVAGIDAVLIGPYDLSASMGKMGQIDDPAVTNAIDHVTKTCQQAGVRLGIFGVTVDAVKPYMESGYTFIVAGVDTLMLGQAAQQLKTDLKP